MLPRSAPDSRGCPSAMAYICCPLPASTPTRPSLNAEVAYFQPRSVPVLYTCLDDLSVFRVARTPMTLLAPRFVASLRRRLRTSLGRRFSRFVPVAVVFFADRGSTRPSAPPARPSGAAGPSPAAGADPARVALAMGSARANGSAAWARLPAGPPAGRPAEAVDDAVAERGPRR